MVGEAGAVAVMFLQGAAAQGCSLQCSGVVPPALLTELPVAIGTAPLYFTKLVRGLIYKTQICHTGNVDF